MTTVNLLQKHFKQLSYYTASNWYYILIELLSVTKSSIRVKTNRGNFLEMQYGFYRYALLADLLWLVVERVFTKNPRKAGT